MTHEKTELTAASVPTDPQRAAWIRGFSAAGKFVDAADARVARVRELQQEWLAKPELGHAAADLGHQLKAVLDDDQPGLLLSPRDAALVKEALQLLQSDGSRASREPGQVEILLERIEAMA